MMFYNGPSPDEVALVEFAQIMGFECILNTDDQVKIRLHHDDFFEDDDNDAILDF